MEHLPTALCRNAHSLQKVPSD